MPLINCKLKLEKFCVLCANGNDYVYDHSNNITFTITDTKLNVPIATLPEKDNQTLSKLVSKGIEDHFIGIIIK